MKNLNKILDKGIDFDSKRGQEIALDMINMLQKSITSLI